MCVCNTVEDDPACFTASYQTGEPELSELMARRGFRCADDGGEVADAELTSFQEGIYHAKPYGVGEELETSGEVLGVVVRHDTIAYVVNPFGIEKMFFGGVIFAHRFRVYRVTY